MWITITGKSVDTLSRSCFVAKRFSSMTESSNPIPKIHPVSPTFSGVAHSRSTSTSSSMELTPASGGGRMEAPTACAGKPPKCTWASISGLNANDQAADFAEQLRALKRAVRRRRLTM